MADVPDLLVILRLLAGNRGLFLLFLRLFGVFLGDGRISRIDAGDADQVAPFHRLAALRAGDLIGLVLLDDLQPAREIRRRGGAKLIGVEATAAALIAGPVTHPSGALAAVAEVNRRTIVGMSGQNPDCGVIIDQL